MFQAKRGIVRRAVQTFELSLRNFPNLGTRSEHEALIWSRPECAIRYCDDF